jgi:lipopolysaccharide/colanic/teichoic acid biosynthesis glycosyltransferase
MQKTSMLAPTRQLPTPDPAAVPAPAAEAASLYLFVKRALDIAVAGGGLLLLAPLMAVIPILIRLDSKGPAVFRQIRIGRDGKPFTFFKFRSMFTGADVLKPTLLALNEADYPLFKIRDDPRVTRVGRILRKTSFDELPQLWNVLRGDMTLIGPRPHLPEEVEHYTERQKARLSVQPGITCLWQVSRRVGESFEDWIEMDLEYIRRRSWKTDLSVLWKTALVVFNLDRAY